MLYLLDTDISSYIVNERYHSVLARFEKLVPEDWAISAITYAEILFGLEPWPSNHPLRMRARKFLLDANILDWPTNAAFAYADIRHRARSQPLDRNDMLIAAHAITIDAILVTNNIRHHSRMGGGLRFENWVH